MNTKKLLIIFYKNPVLGKVKTRLAATLGDQKAFAIYLQLAHHTQQICQTIAVDKVVYYSDYMDTADFWEAAHFKKEVQRGETLGERMLNAFAQSFQNDYQQVCIIGTDCLELTANVLQQAFDDLIKKDIVLGLAKDGGYYLLGMKKVHESFFYNKKWSTHTVGHDTLLDILHQRKTYSLLPLLSDVDVEEDLKGKNL